MKNNNLSLTRFWVVAVFMTLLSGCVNTDNIFNNSLFNSSQQEIASEPTENAQFYQLKSAEATGSSKINWQIMELKAHVVAKNYTDANTLINILNTQQLTDSQQAEIQLARAKITSQSSAKKALDALNFPSSWQLIDLQWANYYLLRADLYKLTRDLTNSNNALISAKKYQQSSQYVETNELIWNNVKQYSVQQLSTFNSTSNNTELDGWLNLATAVRATTGSPADAQRAVQQWFKANSSHSAVTHTPKSLQAILNLEVISPSNIAILLPQSGKYAKPANLILDGFMRALINDRSSNPNQVNTSIFDTSSTDLATIYEQVKTSNADMIVGPLTKSNVEKLQAINPDINVLALNIPSNTSLVSNICYFNLSPEQEAEQAAKHIAEQGYSYPVVLYPSGSLGTRINKAFIRAWNQYAATPVSTQAYSGQKSIKGNLSSVFSRQRNVDAIYIVGSRNQISMVRPFIEVTLNPSRPAPKYFSNSMSNDGKDMLYHDLGGIEYSDIPLIINEDTSDNDSEQYGNNKVAKRLYALGLDAYNVAQNMSVMKTFTGHTVLGKTGTLNAGGDCVIQRELIWAEHEASFAPDTGDEDSLAEGEAPNEEASATDSTE